MTHPEEEAMAAKTRVSGGDVFSRDDPDAKGLSPLSATQGDVMRVVM